jgi:serine protein kinase
MYPITVPWNLRVEDEIKIYEKMIRESDFRNIHIAPHTLRIAAEFAVLSRLTPSTKINSLVEKMKIYNGDIVEEMKKQEIDVKALREEGKQKGEGMSGISPRFIINALNIALGMKEEKKCVNPIDILRALRHNFEHHISSKSEEKDRYINLLIGEKESVSSEYKTIAKKEVNMAFLAAYEEQAQSLFENYLTNASAFCKNEKVYDSITGEYSDPDDKLMRQIEEYIGIPVNSKKEFRNGIFVYKSAQLEKGLAFTFKDYDPLRLAIEKKLMSDLKDIVSLTIADKSSTDEKAKKRRQTAIDRLLDKGYCQECSSILLSFVGEILRKEN